MNLLENESLIRISIAFSLLFLFALWEVFYPFKSLIESKSQRWFNNFALLICDIISLKLIFPIAALGLSIKLSEKDIGLFNIIQLPLMIELILTLVILDLLIYWQHRIFHRIPILWRIHKVHHSDKDFDVSTAIRFHPLEIILSMGIKFVAICVLGPSALAVILFEIILNGLSIFNHGNIKLPRKLDSILRHIIVTPDYHRVHHSIELNHSNQNFCFNMSIWDRMFGTYDDTIAKPDMIIGLKELNPRVDVVGLWGLLKIPFIKNDTVL